MSACVLLVNSLGDRVEMCVCLCVSKILCVYLDPFSLTFARIGLTPNRIFNVMLGCMMVAERDNTRSQREKTREGKRRRQREREGGGGGERKRRREREKQKKSEKRRKSAHTRMRE